MRKLGLDLGNRSLGIAVSDATCLIATSKENFRFPAQRFDLALEKVSTYLSQYRDVGLIVVGVPYNATDPRQAAVSTEFIALLKANQPHPVVGEDEYLTTRIAMANLKSLGLNRKQQTARKDQESARLILQAHLDKHGSKIPH